MKIEQECFVTNLPNLLYTDVSIFSYHAKINWEILNRVCVQKHVEFYARLAAHVVDWCFHLKEV
jgi:hypothetical protein